MESVSANMEYTSKSHGMGQYDPWDEPVRAMNTPTNPAGG